MGFFSFNKPKSHFEVVCDIGSGSIAVSIVEFQNGVFPKIIFVERVVMPDSQTKNPALISLSMSNSLKEGLSQACQFAISEKIKIKKVSCFYSSPWFLSQAHLLKLEQQKPTVFSDKTLSTMLSQQEHSFSKEENMLVIEKRITKVKLNGYETHNPFEKKASSVEVSVFTSAVSKDTLFLVEDNIKKAFSGVSIQHHTFALTSFAVLRNTFSVCDSFFVLDISGELTDISFVNNGMLMDTMSYPLGRNSIIRKVVDESGLDSPLAISAISMHTKKEIHDEHCVEIENAITSAKKDWLTHLDRALGELAKKTVIPQTLYIIADNDMLTFFESTVKKNEFSNYILSGHSFNVIPVDSEVFNKNITYLSSAQKDFFVAAEVMYLQLLAESHHLISDGYVIE